MEDKSVDDERRMTFIEHLDELRRRLIASIIALSVATSISYFLFKYLVEFIKKPLPLEYREIPLKVWGPLSLFMVRFKLAVIAGFIFASPIIIYEILAFLTPALKSNEKRYVRVILPFLIILFLGGVFFAYYLVIPPAINWLISQGEGQLDLFVRAEEYINFMGLFMLAFGVAFETPLVIMLLIKLGIVKREVLRKQWRIVYVACFVIAAIATPDWSIPPMMILGVALVFLFELSLLLARWL
jgi:sec-independent protein translocase protein TatC